MKGHRGKCGTSWIAWLLVVIGALNWGLIGIGAFVGGNWNVINLLFSWFPVLEWILYVLVGISGIVMLLGCKCRKCKSDDCGGCGACGSCRAQKAAGRETNETKESREHQEHHS